MTVKELKEQLDKFDDNTIVILSRDSEGNSYSPILTVEDGMSYRDGEIGITELTEEDEENGYAEEDVMRDGEKCIVLWPK